MPGIHTEDRGRVRIVTLARPEKRNALDAGLREELISALETAEVDAAVGAVVLTGTGRVFAAGADLQELLDRSSDEQRAFLSPPHIYSVVEGLQKPVVAALNGHALGAGLELATACDVRVAAPAAKLGQPEINLALIPGGGGTQRLVRLVGRGQAARVVLTGKPVTTDEALRIGLVDVVADDVVAAAVELAAAMAEHDPEALAAAKECLHAAVVEPYEDGLQVEVDHFVRLHAREEARRRVQAFLER